MRLSDRVAAMTMHATARWSVRYGDELRFAGTDLPRPRRHHVPTRHGRVPVHVYTDPACAPGSRPRPAYVHLHGGAFTAGAPQACMSVADLIADAGAVVVSLDYPLAPDHPFPQPAEAAHAALDWISRHRRRLGVLLPRQRRRVLDGA